jgi:XTP/dITP diphosphohydrolase
MLAASLTMGLVECDLPLFAPFLNAYTVPPAPTLFKARDKGCVEGDWLRLFFVTGNDNKLREVKEILKQLAPSVEVVGVDLGVKERKLDSLEEVAAEEAREAYARLQEPLFVEDAGLFIEALNGFPGPYSAYVYRTIGNEGILKLMKGVEDRRAAFKSAIALCLRPGRLLLFTGVVEGEVAYEARGGGWGFDPIFAPRGAGGLTFGELGQAKNQLSHRRRALESMANYLLSLREEKLKSLPT